MNEHLLKNNKEVFEKLNIYNWHKEGITGKEVNVAIIGYGGVMKEKKPWLTNVNTSDDGGSYHDGDELINAVAPDSKIYSINIFKGGWNFEEALKWILEHDIDIVCTSIRKTSWCKEEEEISKKLYERNTIMIDSSDNEGKEDSIAYPAQSKYWYAVGSYSEFLNGRAGYVSYGKELDILSYTGLAVHADANRIIPITHTSGTTQAVSGMVALLKEAYRIDNTNFKQYIKDNSLDLGSNSWDKETGWGLFKLEEKPNIDKIKPPIKEDLQEQEEGQNILENTKFKDINNHWAMTNIQKVVDAGLMNGYEDGTFRPDDYPTRAELATILVRALKL
ncbi:S8 family serine peptidase [Tepidibacter hydrothermalis]|uniref:S-layer homology domain-containing protein n=1 Tax=Tepidibacter hydrothermalis TaxID=3036126 RepID=A0ABY8EHN4_9FIRM|nr:S8 family serine peptidase [Tepidibacter hydrothermalis]WFD12444.1 S-layer homology domain-containing protein [Tepidibacter hydrothermalis]